MPASRGTQRTDPATSRLTGWIEPVVGAAGYDLEDLVVTPAGRRSVVRVVVDRDAGVTLDDIAEVSRAVSEVLDRNDDGMGRTPYVLEVTSPGVDRPLTEPRHWRRNTGRLVTVPVGPTGATEELTGRVTEVDVVLVEDGGDRTADLGHVVESDPLVAVDHDPDDAAAARGGDHELLQGVTGGDRKSVV